MSLSDAIGGFLRAGLSPRTMDRLKTGARNAGDNVETTLNEFIGADRVRQAKDYFREEQVGGLSGAQIGGAGALLGALFGGGVGGAAKGGALAVLGSLAYQAYQSSAEGAEDESAPVAPPTPAQVEAMTGVDAERLVLRAMIAAAKADGRIDAAEMDKLVGRLGAAVDDADRRFIEAEIAAPATPAAIAAAVGSPEAATEVYLASLLAIELDAEAEKAHLRALAEALGLAPDVVARLHRMTGAPAP